jgi:hypothetical protein
VTDANTEYRNGSCTDLAPGVLVEARGEVVNGVNLAQRVRFEEAEEEEFEVEGVILAADTSTCPNASFTVQDEESSQTVAVVTDANTEYRNGSCADLLLGVVVEARGQVVNGENLAQRVAFEEEDDDDDDDDDGED